MLTERLGQGVNVRLCNDAAAAASAICSAANEMEASDLLLILISEGIGGTIVRNGSVVEGFNGFSGEIGQMVMAPILNSSTSKTFQPRNGGLGFGVRLRCAHFVGHDARFRSAFGLPVG